jgi:hypothetical protein
VASKVAIVEEVELHRNNGGLPAKTVQHGKEQLS